MRFGLVLGWFAVLKISDWALKYVTFECNFLCFHWQKIIFLKNLHSIEVVLL